MKKKLLLGLILVNGLLFAQVGIGTENPTNTLDINGDLRIRTVNKSNNGADKTLVIDSKGVVRQSDVNIKNTLYIYARGKKETVTDCNNINQQSFSLSDLSDSNIIDSTGAITANKDGYYQYIISIRQYLPAFKYLPLLSGGNGEDGLGSYDYTIRGATEGTRIWNKNSMTGIVYLSINQKTPGFLWNLGGYGSGQLHKCSTGDKIGTEEVVWMYLGNDN